MEGKVERQALAVLLRTPSTLDSASFSSCAGLIAAEGVEGKTSTRAETGLLRVTRW